MILANTRTVKGCELKSICSSEPSSKSERNRLSSDNIAASNADTQITPGAIACNNFGCAPTPRGNKVTTKIKKNTGLATSALRRRARIKSRRIIAKKAVIYTIKKNYPKNSPIKNPEYEKEHSFPKEIEKLYQISLRLRI